MFFFKRLSEACTLGRFFSLINLARKAAKEISEKNLPSVGFSFFLVTMTGSTKLSETQIFQTAKKISALKHTACQSFWFFKMTVAADTMADQETQHKINLCCAA